MLEAITYELLNAKFTFCILFIPSISTEWVLNMQPVFAVLYKDTNTSLNFKRTF